MSATKCEGLVVRIQVKDERGRVIGEIDAVSLKGLLSLAHDEEVRTIRTRIVELPTETNGQRAVVRAAVRTKRGLFTATGDATPENVNPEVSAHTIRAAESRAIARALRFAVNIGEVAVEELGARVSHMGGQTDRATGAGYRAQQGARADGARNETLSPTRPERFRGRDDRPTEASEDDQRAMSGEQRKYLYRLAFQLGESPDSSTARVLKALGVERLESATRRAASLAIDALKADLAKRRSNGHANGASHG